jgi:galactokinase
VSRRSCKHISEIEHLGDNGSGTGITIHWQMNISAFSEHFEKLLGGRPRLYRAPGRVNLIGEHTDYNDGFVMPAAIGFSTYIGVAPRADQKLAIHSQQFPDHFSFELDDVPPHRTGLWCDYVLGVARELLQHGIHLSGANLLVQGEVPMGAGLSSSAALEVASAFALLGQASSTLPRPQIATLCRRAENNFVGARVGIMDQFVSCMGKSGHAILLDCRSLEFQLVPIPSGVELVICNTMVKHDHAAGTYNSRRAECEEGVRILARRNPAIHALRDVSVEMLEQYASDLPPIILKRCSHVIHEDQRTLDAARALASGDLPRVSTLMAASHCSLRDLYEVSCRELDIMVDAAQGLPGFIGGRMTGGGFGGCTINLVRQKNANGFAAQITDRYRTATGIDPQTYICSAEDGAQELSLA